MKTIQDLEEINKPREKLYKKGAQALKDYELLSVLLGSGVKGKDVITLSKEIIKILETDFTSITLEMLTSIHGLGKAKASQVLASIELCKRYLSDKQKIRISSSRDVYEELIPYKDKQQEYFLCIYLDGANHLINTEVISIGTLNQSLVHPREVFSYAIEKRCASIILAHNHPSGTLEPSLSDINITKRLQEAGKILGIDILDHVIFTQSGFYSFKEEGIL
ncbi:RadC family protein [Poseidonibacter ostreae]|jgi:DNA repair protein RadC|uniref:DNA repair protein RadC n=1 Tax=Poseidonibacter ostreae TaxID=2654171 RepID=A0A6L4WPY0_9BACT|nr:DNA repair protein RadC [Poseidonibacter ostreae]KAB7884529.1 DNA repair protein RadC [Poseidonibacter ostreae]KAB7885311.1 DNA repair protein RadC [Poseidonibacter ostreae]KAB7886730.1 DNA repair protein RadC [Poseidonibacter ostreae]